MPAVAAAVVPVAFLGLLVLWPLAAVFQRSLAGVGLAEALAIVGRPSILRVLWFTVWQAALSAGITLVLGLPVAQVMARYRFRGRAALRALVVVPFVLPTVVVAAAMGAVFERVAPDLDRSLAAIVAAHVFFNLAVIVRVVGGYWAGLDRRQVEAAMILGASPARAWWTITLRQLIPVLSGSFLLIFLFCFTSFGVIRVLGGLRLATVETEIYRYAIARQEFDVAAVLAALQIMVVLVLAVGAARFQRHHTTSRRPVWASLPVVGLARRVHLAVVLVLVAVMVGLPVVVTVEQSLRVGSGYGFDHYRALSERIDLLPLSALAALGNSLIFAAVAGAVASLVGLVAAVVITRGGSVGRTLEVVALLPLGVSAVTLGFGYLIGLTAFDLRRSVALVPLAHAVVGLPFVLASVVPALRSIDPRVREVAAVLGASPLTVRRTIDWPLVRRSLATGAGFAAAVSIGEFGATSFLGRGEDTFTAPLAIFRLLSSPGEAVRGQALALSVVVGATVATVAAIIEWRRDGAVTVL